MAIADNPLSFDAPFRGTPATIRIYLIFLETKIMGLSAYILPLIVWVIFIQIFLVGSVNRFFCNSVFRPLKVAQDHPRSLTFLPIESAYATSY